MRDIEFFNATKSSYGGDDGVVVVVMGWLWW